MARPPLEVADIFRIHGGCFRATHRISAAQHRVIRAIELCRTAALGGHVDQCDGCGHLSISYNSCRNRHCPKCQSLAKAKWLEARESELLPVQYFHVVFTVPEQIAPIALQNKRVVYNILFRSVAETLMTIAADRKHLGARIGFLAVLHTWGQTLLAHPHIHCVVPGGGLSENQKRWIGSRKKFFLSVRLLSRMFRGKFLSYLKDAFRSGKLSFHGKLASLNDSSCFHSYLEPLYKAEWVVYSKPPFGAPAQVLNYLGRYTHRIAISNNRLLKLENGKVTFRWKDYRNGNQLKTMTIPAQEFIRRFLMHVLPGHFVRIRHFGLLANRTRKHNLALCRKALQLPPSNPSHHQLDWKTRYQALTGISLDLCPVCKKGRMHLVEILPPLTFKIDSS